MYVRLAFAVAAHLEPEILIVDEVLAVGDAQFQKKCLGKIEEAGKEGRTVLFVSHNMGTITQLCNKGIYLIKFLMPGSYIVTLVAHEPMIQFYDVHKDVLFFNFNETGTKLAKYQRNTQQGGVIVQFPWVEK